MTVPPTSRASTAPPKQGAREGHRRWLWPLAGVATALIVLGLLLVPMLWATAAQAQGLATTAAVAPVAGASVGGGWPWWAWPLALFLACFVMGMIAVPAGIGGGTLFVPIIGGFFPFHLDFVRGAGLLVALASALSAAPTLLHGGLASLRLALPLACLGSISAIAGAVLGLAMPVAVVQMALGLLILSIVVVMLRSRGNAVPQVAASDALGQALRLHGVFVDAATGQRIEWRTHRTPQGLAVFTGIGLLAGMFGIGAGWANVPALNLLMGAPLKVSAATSGLVLSLVDSSAAWVYLNKGAVLPLIAVPSVVGIMLGARIGARLLTVLDARVVRRLVIGVLLFAGARALYRGVQAWA